MAGVTGSWRPFAYRPNTTVVHRASAGIKLAVLLAVSVIIFISPAGLAAALLLILTAAAAARVPPWELLKGSKMLVTLSVCIILLKTFERGVPGITTPEIILGDWYIPDMHLPLSAAGFIDGLMTALRILTSFAAAGLLFAVTTMRELRLSLAAIELRLRNVSNKQPVAYFSLGITLMLGFIPRFFDLWETAHIACDARSCTRGPRRLLLLIPLLTERMMEAAADTALALEARALGNEADGIHRK